MKKIINSIRIVVVVVIMAVIELILPNMSHAYDCFPPGTAGYCNDRRYTHSTTYYTTGYCSNPASYIQCSINSPNPVYCAGPYNGSQCHNSSSGGFSGYPNNGNYYDCGAIDGGTYAGGLCPGDSSVQCCVYPPPPSVTASCSSGNFTVNWTQPPGHPYSYVRIYDSTAGSYSAVTGVVTGTSYTISAVPSHTYSYWVHTSNASGDNYSIDTPRALTASVTCPALPACTSDPDPLGSVISTGVPATASNVWGGDTTTYGPQNAVDGSLDGTKYWNAGGGGPQWIELNLGAPQQVSGIKLYFFTGTPVTPYTEQVYVGTTPNPSTLVKSMTCNLSDGQIINQTINQSNVQYIRIAVPSSGAAWVALNELTVYGAAPGSQTTTPGIIFSGGDTAVFGQGSASVKNWVVGSLGFPEMYSTTTNQSTTAYNYVLDRANKAKIHITDLSSICPNLANCTLPLNLQNGVYQANGNLNLNSYAFLPNKNYVFLVNGDLRILGNMVVPNGSTAFFTASNNIIIDRNVGTATNLFPLPAGQLQGIFSADHNFVIDSINNCVVGKDKMLNVEGSIITNAFGNGGTFQNTRDLCGDNPNYPALTIRLRLDMLLNLPQFLMKQKTTFREDNP